MNLLINTNAKNIPLADGSVHCVVTSPPYYGLRDYGTAKWQGGDTECDHVEQYTNPQVSACSGGITNKRPDLESVQTASQNGRKQYRNKCAKCGAVRIDQQIGLEQTPAEYVDDIVQVFREVWRVLRDDGVVFLNLGDSYVSNTGDRNKVGGFQANPNKDRLLAESAMSFNKKSGDIKSKDLIGIPWMVAFALRDDGWWLRQDIIWHKPNPMPESVKDRCTKAHEYVFLLSKSPRYYYDYEAVLEPANNDVGKPRAFAKKGNGDRNDTGNVYIPKYYKNLQDDGQQPNTTHLKRLEGEEYVSPVRNRRSVWTIPTSPYRGAHYATFPPKLIEPMILAGCPQVVCAKCGAPYVKVVTKSDWKRHQSQKAKDQDIVGNPMYRGGHHNDGLPSYKGTNKDYDLQPTCDCNAGTTSGIVLDPFVGSGTTVMVANQLGRRGIGLDLSFKYLQENAKQRIAIVQPVMFS